MHTIFPPSRKRAFSLVELSIVLVILGLLVGGILAGQSLIRAAELRAVGTERDRWMTAVQAFRDKYMAIPGDMKNATSFWGDQASGTASCADAAITDGNPGTCNGDGNGFILDWQTEMHRFWQHLGLAGLIEGSYTGYAGSSGGSHVVPGVNAPASKMSGAAWGTMGMTSANVGDGNWYAGNYGNYFIFGGPSTNIPANQNLMPAELWNIDKKLDDGMPGRGKIIAFNWTNCTNSTAVNDYDKTYRLDVTNKTCALLSINAF